ncbi:MAG: hypothetical protein CMF53_04165 [Legionellales bacterium]|nr:hypothetical protein [Legionellales bacterium]
MAVLNRVLSVSEIKLMQSFEENLAKLCVLLQEHAKGDVVVNSDTRLSSELGIDSARLMEVLLEVEDAFDVSIPLNVLPNVYTVSDLCSELQKILGARR